MDELKIKNNNKQRNSKIPDTIIKIIDVINKTFFRIIQENINNVKIVEKKLIYINNLIKKIFQQKEKSTIDHKYKSERILLKSYNKVNNASMSLKKENNDNKNILKEKNDNENIKNQCEMDSNKYLIFKLKKKLKKDHDKDKIKELEYLERIAILQCKLNLYERNFEKLLLENNINKNIRKKNINKNNNNNNYCFKIRNCELREKGENIYRPYSSIIDAKINNLKKYFPENNNNINKSVINTYISANTNTLDSYLNRNKKRNCCRSLNNLNYKYQIGNNYLRNDFIEIKKTIHKNNIKINKFMSNYVKNH